MGAYVNPEGKSKEQWLAEHGIEMKKAPDWADTPPNHLPACLVDNGMFTAAGIAYSEKELAVFKDLTDTRPKRWFFVETDRLHTVSPELIKYMNLAR